MAASPLLYTQRSYYGARRNAVLARYQQRGGYDPRLASTLRWGSPDVANRGIDAVP